MAAFRILVIRLSSMGDIVHTLPAVANLKQSFPESHLSWLIRPRWLPLLEGNPFVDEIIPMERSISATLACARRLRATHFDLVVDFQGLLQTGVVAAAIRPAKLVGFGRKQVRERAAGMFYSHSVATNAEHAVDRNLDLAAGAGATSLPPVFPLPDGAPEGNLPDGKFILANPLAGWGSKQWPQEFWSQLAALGDLPLVVNGPPHAAAELAQIRGAHVHISGVSGLIHATRRAYAVIGVDSGPMHLAAALGKPGVAIFGPTDPARYGPYGGSMRVLRSREAVIKHRRSSSVHESMRAITPQMVAEALTASLAGRSLESPSLEGRPA